VRDAGPTQARFLTQQLRRLPKGKALDVAAGAGRNELYLASHGFQVDALDRAAQAMAQRASTANHRNPRNLTVQTVDLARTSDARVLSYDEDEHDGSHGP